jgi:CheY-like chemotaxis protein/HPt (histidine-containing phosphotransfer) domain-containing protein
MEIVIVDDEPVSLAVLKQLVGKLPDCKARAFAHAAAALAWCDSNDPDVVIVDYMMPELNGIEFTRRLRAVDGRSDTPLLMVTANAENNVRERALESGINDVLNKPFDSTDLQARVSNMLALRFSQRKRANRDNSRAAAQSADAAAETTDGDAVERLLDYDLTLARIGGDTTLLGEIVRIFARSVPLLMTSIGEALNRADLEHVYVESHSLIGAVGSVEAPAVLRAVVQLEGHARDRDVIAAAAVFADVEALVQRLSAELAALIS